MPRDLITLFGFSLLFGIFYLIIFDSRALPLICVALMWMSPIIDEVCEKLARKRLRRNKKVRSGKISNIFSILKEYSNGGICGKSDGTKIH